MPMDKISPFRVGEINIGPEFNNLSHCFLLGAGEEGTKSGNEHCLDREKKNTAKIYCKHFGADLRGPEAGLLEAGAALWLAGVRPAFAAADGSEGLDCSPSSSFSLSFSSCNTSA